MGYVKGEGGKGVWKRERGGQSGRLFLNCTVYLQWRGLQHFSKNILKE